MSVPSILMGVLRLVPTPLDHTLVVVEQGTAWLAMDILVKVLPVINNIKNYPILILNHVLIEYRY